MSDIDYSRPFNGKRMTKITRASVQSNGNLNFPPEAARQLGLSLEKSLLIFPKGKKDLAVIVVEKDHPNGFVIRKTGPYFYTSFREMMIQFGLDYKKVRVVYDIIEMAEEHEGRPVFKFNQRVITHASETPAAEPTAEGAAV